MDCYVGVFKEKETPVPFGTVVNVSIFYCLFVSNKLLVKFFKKGYDYMKELIIRVLMVEPLMPPKEVYLLNYVKVFNTIVSKSNLRCRVIDC